VESRGLSFGVWGRRPLVTATNLSQLLRSLFKLHKVMYHCVSYVMFSNFVVYKMLLEKKGFSPGRLKLALSVVM